MTEADIIVLHLKMSAHLPVPAASLHFDGVWHSSLGVAQIGSDIPGSVDIEIGVRELELSKDQVGMSTQALFFFYCRFFLTCIDICTPALYTSLFLFSLSHALQNYNFVIPCQCK